MNLRVMFRHANTVKKMYVFITIVMLMLIIVLTLVSYFGISQYLINKKRMELISLSNNLRTELQLSLCRDTLRAGILKQTSKERIQVLNTIIQPNIDTFSDQYPGYCFGYYDLEVKSIVAASQDFAPAQLQRLCDRDQLFEFFPGNKLERVEDYNVVTWNQEGILVLAMPVSFQNETIGVIWTYIENNNIYEQVFRYSICILGLIVILLLIPFIATWYMVNKIKTQFISFAESLFKDDGTYLDTHFLPELTPILKSAKAHSQQLRTFEAMVRNSNDPITTISLDFKITSINPAGQKLYGYSLEEVLGKEITILAVPQERQELIEILAKVKAGEEIICYDMQRQKKDGTVIDVSLSISPVKDDQGQISKIMCIHRDVTEKKKIEAEMQKLDGLNLIGQMAASIAHEIRNPMTTVRGFLQLLGSKAGLKEFEAYFELMVEELDRANSIITEFLSLSRNNPISLSEQNLNEIINKLLPMLRADALKNETTIIAELNTIPNVRLNEKEIRQVILNLVRNGLESMPSGGIITINTFLDDHTVVIKVSDQGSGIPAKVLENIGKPFLTTKENGTGLGLAVSYNIVYRHGGTISIETGLQGTTFIIQLPLCKA